MNYFFIQIQQFNFFSYLALFIVALSFFLGKKSKTPYMPLLFSNIGFFIYRFTSESYLGIDFAMYFILSSILCATWFLVISNMEEEENEDRGFFKRNGMIVSQECDQRFNKMQHGITKSAGIGFFNDILEGSGNVTSAKYQNEVSSYYNFSGNGQEYYEHPQRRYINFCTYLILTAIIGSFFLI